MAASGVLTTNSTGGSPRRLTRTILRERTARVALLGLGLSAISAIATFGPPRPGNRAAFFGWALWPLLLLGAGLALLWDARPVALRYASWLILGGLPLGIALGAPFRVAGPVDAILFWLQTTTLIVFIVEAARLTAALERPLAVTALGVPASLDRLRRRERLYRRLLWIAGIAFVLPLAQALSGSAASPRLAVAAAGLLGALACRAFLIDPLERHLQHDPALAQSLSRLRRHARRGRPGAVFYVATTVALVAMALLVLRRVLGLDGSAP